MENNVGGRQRVHPSKIIRGKSESVSIWCLCTALYGGVGRGAEYLEACLGKTAVMITKQTSHCNQSLKYSLFYHCSFVTPLDCCHLGRAIRMPHRRIVSSISYCKCTLLYFRLSVSPCHPGPVSMYSFISGKNILSVIQARTRPTPTNP